jgi:hypothetical protein
MKTLNISIESSNINNEETHKLSLAFKVIKTILVVFMFSLIVSLTSCVVAVPAPRYGTGVIIEHNDGGERHYRGERHERGRRSEHRENRDRRQQ